MNSQEKMPGVIKIGHNYYKFRVWAPFCSQVELKLLFSGGDVLYAMDKDNEGYFCIEVAGVSKGTRYLYVLDGNKTRPDPTSSFQPEGVHGPSCVIDPHEYKWKDQNWKGMALRDIIFYEVHIGTFTNEGTFESAIKKIPYLKQLGITCLEIMPVAQFPGVRNWGYDGVGLYAVQNSYGGSMGFKKLVDTCHRQGIAVCLDVVYNHLGPEGNYLHDYGPYFTKKYHTPWGDAVNFDDKNSKHVRHFIINNALYWLTEYHVDALRLDAIHKIFDFSTKHILQELNETVQIFAKESKRKIHVIAESDLNDSRIIKSSAKGGYGLAGQWSDDFHHAVHSYLSLEHNGYYEDFGKLEDISKAIEAGFVYDGKYSFFRKRRHGNSSKGIKREKLIVYTQNHDQIGNRAFGDRLSTIINFDKEKLAAVLLLLAPNTPLLFMGQEYSEHAPFRYFIDHTDVDLVLAVQEGRKKKYTDFGWKEIPDPKVEKTFFDSNLSWNFKKRSPKYNIWRLYKDLIFLRKTKILRKTFQNVCYNEKDKWISFEYMGKKSSWLGVIISFLEKEQQIPSPFSRRKFYEILNTTSRRYGGWVSKNKRNTANKYICVPSLGAVVYDKEKNCK